GQQTADVEIQGPQLQTEQRNTQGRDDWRLRERLVSRGFESNFPDALSLPHFLPEGKTFPLRKNLSRDDPPGPRPSDLNVVNTSNGGDSHEDADADAHARRSDGGGRLRRRHGPPRG